MLQALAAPGVYERLEAAGARLEIGLRQALEESRHPGCVTRVGSLLTLFFGVRDPVDWTSVADADTRRFAAWFHRMLERGVYLAPSQFEALFLSLAHGDDLIDRTIATGREVLKGMRWGPEA
jgi:glutamate-1-semialdehyde 2,1-aminomutase